MSPKAKSWLWMLAVIISETSATSTLKMFDNSEGITKTLLLGLIIVLYIVCYYSLSRAVKNIPVGLAYATWSGTGMSSILGMAVIASGIVIMNLFSKMGSEEESEETTELSNIKQTVSSVNK